MVHYPLILLLGCHISLGLAWSWSAHTTHSSIDQDIHLASALGDKYDISALFKGQDVLGPYHQKPDCFRDAVALVKTRCEESHMNEQDRVQAAISMTLCELATARHSTPPLECAAFARSRQKLPPPSHAQPECVEALSRSAQFWSSYSGYLREIPQLCFAFRRWIDIDTAKDIYRNITAEKMSLLRLLTEREKTSKAAQQLWEQTSEHMLDVLSELRITSDEMRSASGSLATSISSALQSVTADMEHVLQGIGNRDRTNHLEAIAKFDTMLETVGREHSKQLTELLPSIRSSITSELSTAFAVIQEESQRNVDVAHQVWRQLDLLESSVAAMHDSVYQLAGALSDASQSLEISVSQAHVAQTIQEDALVAMSHLVDAVILLTQTTHSELKAINETTTAMTRSLTQRASWQRWKSVLTWTSQLLPGLSSAYLAFVMMNALRRVLYLFVSLFTSAFALTKVGRWLPFRHRDTFKTKEILQLGSAVPCTTSLDNFAAMDPGTTIVHRTHEQRTTRRSYRPRYSRIPDRLCRPSTQGPWA
ncbi:hypothetical protein F5I97DRAFT_135194 [Phlebopus sp. FC_14]|nr:hypothetical protein F5I97DRAFT_135194 [Phlebopus sp. FC_14]